MSAYELLENLRETAGLKSKWKKSHRKNGLVYWKNADYPVIIAIGIDRAIRLEPTEAGKHALECVCEAMVESAKFLGTTLHMDDITDLFRRANAQIEIDDLNSTEAKTSIGNLTCTLKLIKSHGAMVSLRSDSATTIE